MKASELKLVADAAHFFEDPSLFTRLMGGAGNYVESSLEKLPPRLRDFTLQVSRKAIERCLRASVATLPRARRDDSERLDEILERQLRVGRWHSAASAVIGGVGGFGGPFTLAVELPLSTTVILRSIASTAADFAFDPRRPEVLLECFFVFALGGPATHDDGLNSMYLSSRVALASLIRQAAGLLEGQSVRQLARLLEGEASSALVQFVAKVSESFGLRVGRKVLAQVAPVVGAVGGAALNAAFADYYSRAARFHFGLKRLEEIYGPEEVQRVYTDALRTLKSSKTT